MSIDPRMLTMLIQQQLRPSLDQLTGGGSQASSGAASAFDQILSQLSGAAGASGLADADASASADSGMMALAAWSGLSAGTGLNGQAAAAAGGWDASASPALQAALIAAGSGYASSAAAWIGEGAGSAGAEYEGLIASAAARHGLSPKLIRSVIEAESSFQPLAVSGAGAKGLMQLMDGTARGLGVTDSFDPAQNIDGGSKYLSYLLRKLDGSVPAALAAYNAGPGRLDRLGIRDEATLTEHFSELPQETQSYVVKIMAKLGGSGTGL
ncbi:lytic transglycosylase domain-containing protein [Paenibacillus pasadenensis]|uniref:transglycosylase SLT domain-containing protein n=1 Tax=Paenibacillus TaxID=44249 RepID=UPI0003FD9471|nr:lytic transglycosylase domain-containing protein [Paenibacillus pasadenensis]